MEEVRKLPSGYTEEEIERLAEFFRLLGEWKRRKESRMKEAA